MLFYSCRARAIWAPIRSVRSNPVLVSRRMLRAAPQAGEGPLMERRPDRELPELDQVGRRWLSSGAIFVALVAASGLALFNYQKSSSSVVASTLFALRTSATARAALGDEIYFAHYMPWIWGEINQLHGRINIHFSVKGTKNYATVRFKSMRPTRQGVFETIEWSLEMPTGEKLDLLEASHEPPVIVDQHDLAARVVNKTG
ncbi:cytochrome oxidase assembly [Blumeria hordei DH14]|uniref:Cytochrome oxidase assembly n=1 Tax=Blumeria graminis f. sp. hordei (strain DH14) TaxID=546991 RepID=N1JCH6_BLUG1|nr:cytochrome oxidase assembly [Blumeria hordei DH14]